MTPRPRPGKSWPKVALRLPAGGLVQFCFADVALRDRFAAALRNLALGRAWDAAPAAEGEGEAPLPAGWTKKESAQYPGHFFYANDSGTTWEHPAPAGGPPFAMAVDPGHPTGGPPVQHDGEGDKVNSPPVGPKFAPALTLYAGFSVNY